MASVKLSEFVKNLNKFDDAIQMKAINIFDKRTVDASGESQQVAPYKTGLLQRSVTIVKAKITPSGIRSAYIFTANNKGFPYPVVVEAGVRNGKELNISKKFNRRAQSGFGQFGIDSVSDDLVDDMARLAGEVFKSL